MKDAVGKDLKLGQRVAIPCNSRFKIGVLYNYRDNRGKWYLEAVEYVERKEAGTLTDEDRQYHWRDNYWNREYVDSNSHNYYIQFPDGKKRTLHNRESIIGIADDGTIEL